VPWLRRLVAGLSPRRPGFAPGSVHVGFVVDKVALGQVFLRVLRFSPVSIIPPWFSILIYHLGDEQQFRDVVSPHRNLQSTNVSLKKCAVSRMVVCCYSRLGRLLPGMSSKCFANDHDKPADAPVITAMQSKHLRILMFAASFFTPWQSQETR